MIEGGAVELLRERSISVTVEEVDRDGPFRDTASSSAKVNERLAAAVADAVKRGALPIVLTGSCNSCLGVLAGFEHARCGAVWIDAHADFNTPESAASGFFPGMSLAIATGHCYRSYWSRIGDSTPVAEENVALFGTRDLWPEAEEERVEHSSLEVVRWRDGRPQRDVAKALDRLAARVDELYLHIDFDGFDPEVAPGIVDDPAPGGLSFADARAIIVETAKRFRVRAATLATYTPARDQDARTLRLGLSLIDLIGAELVKRR